MSKTLDKYLKDFFEEKDLDDEIFEIEHKDKIHLVESGIVIELIHSAPAQEKQKIASMLRQIDFKNGNINHFLKHLAGAYIKTQY